jgi:hypothetical protein
VDSSGTRQWLTRALGAVIGLLLIGALLPSEYRRAAVGRLVTPFAGVAWPKATEIAVLSTLPQRVASGDRVEVRMRLDRGDRPSARATVYYQYEGGPVRSEAMTRSPDGTYSVSLDARASAAAGGAGEANAGLRVWVRAGDDEKPLGSMTVVPRLTVRKVTAVVVPPAYAAATSGQTLGGEVDLTQSPAVVVEGSQLRLKLEFNKPLSGPPTLVRVETSAAATGEPPSPDRGLIATTRELDGAAAELALAPEKTVRFRIAATDSDGFASSALTEYEVVVRPDQAPAIQIELPRRSEDRTATSVVPLEGMAEDDFSVVNVALNVKRLGDSREWRIALVEASRAAAGADWTAAASSPDRSRMRVRYLWELAALTGADLKPGDVLEYYLSASDNYRRETPSGVRVHPEATSSRLRITIVSQDDLAARVADELRNAATQIEQLRQSQRRTTEETRELSEAVAGKPALDEALQRQARRLTEQQSVVASQGKQVSSKLDDLLRRMAENRLENRELATTAQDVRDTLDRASEGPMKSAANELGEARQTPDAASRDNKLDSAERQQDESEKLLSQALERLASLGSLRQTIDNLRRMLAEQQDVSRQTGELARDNVGKRPEEMKPADREKLQQLAERQQSLSQRTEAMLGDMDKQSQQLAKSDPESAEALKKSSETGRQEGVPGAQSKASSAMQQNQQNQARSEQRKAEVGLQVMLNQLKDAERRKLEALTKKLADLSEQIATLVRRQAGHNLDNLGLRDGALKAAEKDLARLLELAERTAEKPAVSDLPALSGGQEQTERNTRGLSESMSGVQGAAEAASAIARAASRMERAAVMLRRSEIASAYEPPQVEALSALEDARKQVEELQRNADEQLKQEQRESIKAQYVAIRAEQDVLNKEVARLGALAARGELPRVDAVRLAQLPGVQGALAERTSKVEEDLIELSSVVFIWANKDIVQAMDGVKNLLGQGRTDAPVRIEQTRILEQLDAMIASLTVKPYDKEFEDRQGGEGGGGQGENQPRIPSEAELRLLKGLQEAVNRATKSKAEAAVGRAAAGERGAIEAVGRRQGDLRDLLGEMVTKASRGRIKLPDEPTKPLAEEAATGRDEDRALEDDLLQGKPQDGGAGPSGGNLVENAANRMARSRQRLVTDADPGPITQQLQDRILKDLDQLIEEARRQDQQSSSSSSSKSQGGQSKPQPQTGNEQANNQGNQQQGGDQSGQGTQGAQNSNNAGASARDPGKQGGDLRERLAEWGAISPRQRQAIIEGAGDTPIEKYRTLIEDYYRSLAEKQSGGR